MYHWRTTIGPVDLAFTDRFGGVSRSPYDELNLALGGGDDPDALADNHRLLLADFAPGARLADMEQVHGATVVEAALDGRPTCDGIVTDRVDLVLVVRVADCVPVLLADVDNDVIGAAHAGRRGVVSGVVPATVERMRRLGADRVEAWIGPHVCGACYQVPAAMQQEVVAVAPRALAQTRQGTPSLDLGAAVRHQLASAGVVVHDAAACTVESESLYSYRRDGANAGRAAGVIRLRESDDG